MSATSTGAGGPEGPPHGGAPTAVIPVAGAAPGRGAGADSVGRRLAGATAIVGGAFIVSRVLGQLR